MINGMVIVAWKELSACQYDIHPEALNCAVQSLEYGERFLKVLNWADFLCSANLVGKYFRGI
jgi:hypothetical protein